MDAGGDGERGVTRRQAGGLGNIGQAAERLAGPPHVKEIRPLRQYSDRARFTVPPLAQQRRDEKTVVVEAGGEGAGGALLGVGGQFVPQVPGERGDEAARGRGAHPGVPPGDQARQRPPAAVARHAEERGRRDVPPALQIVDPPHAVPRPPRPEPLPRGPHEGVELIMLPRRPAEERTPLPVRPLDPLPLTDGVDDERGEPGGGQFDRERLIFRLRLPEPRVPAQPQHAGVRTVAGGDVQIGGDEQAGAALIGEPFDAIRPPVERAGDAGVQRRAGRFRAEAGGDAVPQVRGVGGGGFGGIDRVQFRPHAGRVGGELRLVEALQHPRELRAAFAGAVGGGGAGEGRGGGRGVEGAAGEGRHFGNSLEPDGAGGVSLTEPPPERPRARRPRPADRLPRLRRPAGRDGGVGGVRPLRRPPAGGGGGRRRNQPRGHPAGGAGLQRAGAGRGGGVRRAGAAGRRGRLVRAGRDRRPRRGAMGGPGGRRRVRADPAGALRGDGPRAERAGGGRGEE